MYKIRRIHARKLHNVSHHAFMYKNEASSSRHSTHIKMLKNKTPTASNEPNVSFKTFDASFKTVSGAPGRTTPNSSALGFSDAAPL
jgi:hypothetical protein